MSEEQRDHIESVSLNLTQFAVDKLNWDGKPATAAAVASLIGVIASAFACLDRIADALEILASTSREKTPVFERSGEG